MHFGEPGNVIFINGEDNNLYPNAVRVAIEMARTINVILTGDAGSGVLAACLAHPAVKRVRALTRRSTGVEHEKLDEIIHADFSDHSAIEPELAGHDACFWCLGVAQGTVGKREYHRITYAFAVAAATVLERVKPKMTFCFLSGKGTSENSRMRWARVKGETEAALAQFDLTLYNFRAGFIHPVDGRKSGYVSARFLYPFIKRSKRLCVEADELGRAMINATRYGYEQSTLENAAIRALAARGGS